MRHHRWLLVRFAHPDNELSGLPEPEEGTATKLEVALGFGFGLDAVGFGLAFGGFLADPGVP